MYVVQTIRKSGERDFSSFWGKQEAATYWTDICANFDLEEKTDQFQELKLYKVEADSLAEAARRVKKGECPALKSFTPALTPALRNLVNLHEVNLVDNQILVKANKALLSQSGHFISLCEKLVAQLNEVISTLVVNPVTLGQQLPSIQHKTYDLKAQGDCYNYPLLSIVGDQLDRFLDQITAPQAQPIHRVRILKAFSNSIQLILTHKLIGKGGDLGTRLLERLHKLLHDYKNNFEIDDDFADILERNVDSQEKLTEILAGKNGKKHYRPIVAERVCAEDFNFKAAYRTGCNEFDEDHRYILHLIKMLYREYEKQGSLFITDSIIVMLEAYTRIHFGREEMILEKFGDPSLEDHKKEHENLLAEIVDIRNESLNSPNNDSLLEKAIRYKNWHLKHIALTDFGYKEIVKKHNQEITDLLKDYNLPKNWFGEKE
ncbi:hemerythrin family protein [Terasakiella sp. SH-1]|uniref:bacteriohemerythrin n=1 Tax=Terasakiella sp. SH-1 TaxID=2560057 RepID=UPI001073E7E9|nr:hemerythrin family protein [Terasakiella sp. SH-1]